MPNYILELDEGVRNVGYKEAGASKAFVQSLLGHSSASMTDLYLDRYDVAWAELSASDFRKIL